MTRLLARARHLLQHDLSERNKTARNSWMLGTPNLEQEIYLVPELPEPSVCRTRFIRAELGPRGICMSIDDEHNFHQAPPTVWLAIPL